MRSHRIGLQCVPAHCGLQGNWKTRRTRQIWSQRKTARKEDPHPGATHREGWLPLPWPVVVIVTLRTVGGCMEWWYVCFNGTLEKSADYQFRSRNPVTTWLSKFITWTEIKLQQLTQSRLEDSNAVIKLVCICGLLQSSIRQYMGSWQLPQCIVS